MRILVRVLIAIAIMLGVAAAVFFASRGRVLFFPFVLIIGVPLLWLVRPPQDRT